jgi:hypothetical protein
MAGNTRNRRYVDMCLLADEGQTAKTPYRP